MWSLLLKVDLWRFLLLLYLPFYFDKRWEGGKKLLRDELTIIE